MFSLPGLVFTIINESCVPNSRQKLVTCVVAQ